MCYKLYKVDRTVWNVDEQAYRALQACAIFEGRTVGDLLSDAIRGYLIRVTAFQKRGSLRALKPEAFPEERGSQAALGSPDALNAGPPRSALPAFTEESVAAKRRSAHQTH